MSKKNSNCDIKKCVVSIIAHQPITLVQCLGSLNFVKQGKSRNFYVKLSLFALANNFKVLASSICRTKSSPPLGTSSQTSWFSFVVED